jgi:hypothetical protein
VIEDTGYAHVPAKRDAALAVGDSLPPRLARVAGEGHAYADIARQMLGIAERYLPRAHAQLDFAFRLDGILGPTGAWQLSAAGRSPRYGAIVALGLLRLPEQGQRQALGGASASQLIGHLGSQLAQIRDLGDVAMITWAAAEAGHGIVPDALARLAQLDRAAVQPSVVDAAWTVSALVAARQQADVEEHLTQARQRLLAARRGAAYPHLTGGAGPWHRSHIGSFADQIYPVQALARLHRSAGDPAALRVANDIAGVICQAQGASGQWWWHYDARTGAVVEGYPVYSVHQHAMAPMGLLDLADAGGDDHLREVCSGLSWLTGAPETSEPIMLQKPPVAWRKVARSDRRKLVRGARAFSTRLHPGFRLAMLDHVFQPGSVDHECRPYEMGWLPVAWLP